MEDADADPWLAADKAYHVMFCFVLTFLFHSAASLTPHPFLRRQSIPLASMASLLAGAAKEAADHLGYFRSAGASLKDALADLLGVILATSLLSLGTLRIKRSIPPPPPDRGISLV
ncbi:uncharacterized protein LOC107459620 [Arachis duranensis]|uniref:Uncharacterized protein LOC107459620 n=1 Tax=Arachis duranensis TaxID=130453 RepID=A0A6P4B776_ARADU|nr:uncharacterized protein LOC107459620 [Arachis duranensis]XP_025611192.1 uncharacterized protein LOC112703804 [Arachis hypogaea]XP_025673920.1 uncharacterized protein LOC112773093 [Arachis hypogaea]XP_057724489.1 uncharacterized protein LOC130940388 [Arachis stenosperma]QHN94553.1 uncharacterized protein DS421_18g602130 [Arachis hypogaea]